MTKPLVVTILNRLRGFGYWLYSLRPMFRVLHNQAMRSKQQSYLARLQNKEANHAADVAALNQRHADAQERMQRSIDVIAKRASRIEFDRQFAGYDCYCLRIDFDPRMFGGGYWSRDELRYLAKSVAYQVEAEIATARFIQSAAQCEIERAQRQLSRRIRP